MIIPTEGNKVEMGGVLTKPSEFKIANSAHAFNILSQSLYSDKVGAVVREIISNGYDAHVAAGFPERVLDIHLPTSLEPVFSVEDQGIGLSNESMVELYTTYFSSTKQNNDEIGGFGLGCKSPFAYTKTFTVQSIYDGWMRTYSLMVNEDGVPVITMLDEEPTDKCNGVKVSLPVRSFDMQEFRTKAARVLEFFPNFKANLSEFKAAKTKYSHQGPGWAIRDTKHDQWIGSEPRAIVGKVAYRFSLDKMRLTDEDKSILQLPIDLIFNIGELDVTPSRESLSLNKRTQENLVARLKDIQDSILESLRLEIASAPSLWFAKLALKERLGHSSPYRTLVQKVIKNFFPTYQGMVVNDVSTDLNLKDYNHLGLYVRRYNARKMKLEKTVNLYSEIHNRSVSIETNENVYFFMNDNASFYPKTTKRIVEMLKDENPSKDITLYLINTAKGDDPLLVNAEFSKMVDELGVPEVRFVSDLPPVPKKPRAARVASDTCKFAWTLSGDHSAQTSNWDKVEDREVFEGDGPFFYVPLDRLELQIPGMDHSRMYRIWNAAKQVALEVEVDGEPFVIEAGVDCYGLNKQGVDRVKNNPNWINAMDCIKQTTLEVPQDYVSYVASAGTRVEFEEMPEIFKNYIANSNDLFKKMRKIVKGTVFHKQAILIKRVQQLVARANRKTNNANAWEILLGYTGQALDVKKAIPDAISKLMAGVNVKKIHKAYPLLPLIEYHYWRVEDAWIKKVGGYLMTMDTL